jgi:hypothetical protein
MQNAQQRIGNGSLRLPVMGWQYFTIWGGPYRERPQTMAGVKMAEELLLPYTVDIPTKDFKVPDLAMLDSGLMRTVALIVRLEPVYVGCMGGRGRTGLFLAVLVKAFGIKNPVEYVRANYFNHAVETEEQYRFVMDYQVPDEISALLRAFKRHNWWKFWLSNLTPIPEIPLAPEPEYVGFEDLDEDEDDYLDPEECIALGVHLTSVDDDGFCTNCGGQ